MPETLSLPPIPEALTLEALQPQEGSTFSLPFDNDVVVKLTLETIHVTSSERFTLHFRGPLEQQLRQATYVMDHDMLGRVAIFLVPIAKDQHGFLYEAVFSRSLPPNAE